MVVVMSITSIKTSETLLPSFLQTERAGKDYKGITSFGEYLKDALEKTNELINESDELSAEFAAGRTDNIHQVLIAIEKADMALQFTLQVRSKILDAYNEIMRMQI